MGRHWTEQIRDAIAITARCGCLSRQRPRRSTQRPRTRPIGSARSSSAPHAWRRCAHRRSSLDGFDTNLHWYEHARSATYPRRHDAWPCPPPCPGHPGEAGWLSALLSVQPSATSDPPCSGGTRRSAGTLEPAVSRFLAHRMLEAERGALGDVHVHIGVTSEARSASAGTQSGTPHLSVVATVRGDTRGAGRAKCGAAARFSSSPRCGDHRLAIWPRCEAPLGSLLGAGSSSIPPRRRPACPGPKPAGRPGGFSARRSNSIRAPCSCRPSTASRHPDPNVAVFAASGHGEACNRPPGARGRGRGRTR